MTKASDSQENSASFNDSRSSQQDTHLDDETVNPPTGSAPTWFRRKRWLVLSFSSVAVLAVGVFVAVTVVSVNEKPAPDPVAATVPIALTQVDVPKGTKIGIVLTLGQGNVDGTEWEQAAQGAAVAQYRLALGGKEIELVVEDDQGTSTGGVEAVARLAEQSVSGVIIASSGPHTTATAKAASETGIPAVLPYMALSPDLKALEGVWSMAPDVDSTVAATNKSLETFDYPLGLSLGATATEGLVVTETLRPQGVDYEALADIVAQRTGADTSANGTYSGGSDEAEVAPDDQPRADAIVIDGHPNAMAELVAALEARNVAVPMILAPAATSPGFTRTLSQKNGTVSSSMRTTGFGLEDSAALGQDSNGRAMSAYLQALRLLAEDSEATTLSGETPFADSAPWADVRSHDAVLAIVAAAANAGSADPVKVNEGFNGLTLTASEGVAGASMDFDNDQVVSRKVQVLFATGQELGLRPQSSDSLTLEWFLEPSTK